MSRTSLVFALLAGVTSSGSALADRIGAPVYLHAPVASVVDRSPSLLATPYSPPKTTPNPFAPHSQVPSTTGADWLNIHVRRGDSISALFEHYGLPMSDWRKIMALGESVSEPLIGIRSGDELHIRRADNGSVAELRYQIDMTHTLRVMRGTDGMFSAGTVTAKTQKRHGYAVGVINSSLYADGHKAGMSDALILQMAKIFRWDVDFAQDIRPGDRFAVVYEEILRNGKVISTGNILAAEFDTQGQVHRAFRFASHGDTHYYNEKGQPLRKAFLRAPVDFTRISSRFGKRKHPLFKKWRMHTGVDYAAPMGTPIRAAGDGRIEFRGWERGYGRIVKIHHAGHLETLYGHMSRFKSGVNVGTRVKQGQIIGYVGESGYATGPHVHFEFRVNGRPKNPLTVKLPGAPPLPHKLRVAFQSEVQPYVSQLHALSEIRLAKNDTIPTDD